MNLALAKYLSRVETDFKKTSSQLIAAAIAVAPAVLSIAQSETGLALVYFSFFLVMYREGLPAVILIVGFFHWRIGSGNPNGAAEYFGDCAYGSCSRHYLLHAKAGKAKQGNACHNSIDMGGLCRYSAVCRSVCVQACV